MLDQSTLLAGGVLLNVLLAGAVIWTIRHIKRATERDLRRMVWPLVDTLMTLRDEEERR